MAKRAPPVSPGLMLWQVCSGRPGECSNAVGRRLSESRMRENRTYGLRWRGLETWPWWNGELTPPAKERDRKPSTSSRRASPRPYQATAYSLRFASAFGRARRPALDACGTEGYVLPANGSLHACPQERVCGPLLPSPYSHLGEIVPLGRSQMERLRKNISLGVIEAIALCGTT
jgi:hypothetical protein